STVSANTSGGAPGASTISNNGTMTIVNSTISGNTATRAGGVRAVSGTLVLTNVTIANNTGIGLLRDNGTTLPQNVILSANTPNCVNAAGGPIPISNDPNANQNFENDGSCQFPIFANFVGDPLIGPLAANGGPTLTHNLLPGSTAVDLSNCPVPTDQRG